MLKKYAHIIFLSLGLISASSSLLSYVLKDVLEQNPIIAKQTPSLEILPLTGSYITINGNQYQIRQFTYEVKPLDNAKMNNLTFEALIDKYKLDSAEPKLAPGTLYPIYYFASTEEMKSKGYYFLFSVRELDK